MSGLLPRFAAGGIDVALEAVVSRARSGFHCSVVLSAVPRLNDAVACGQGHKMTRRARGDLPFDSSMGRGDAARTEVARMMLRIDPRRQADRAWRRGRSSA